MSEPTELSLEEKLQSTFDQLPELDKNQKYFLFHFSEAETVIVKIGGPLTERQQKWVEGNHQIILEYSNKRSQWELSPVHTPDRMEQDQ